MEGLGPGTRYKYRLNGASEFPDPASRLQPDGVHGPSEIVSGEFEWSDSAWTGIPLSDFIFYELHIGTFTHEGTFGAATQYLDYLADLGITAIELMPVAQFPGVRNWGYEGVLPFAVQNSYGGQDGLKRFVDSAHRKGLAVVLDVIYNHLGPGNYLSQLGPYFTDRYQTPWGPAVNFDGEGNPAVRHRDRERAASLSGVYQTVLSAAFSVFLEANSRVSGMTVAEPANNLEYGRRKKPEAARTPLDVILFRKSANHDRRMRLWTTSTGKMAESASLWKACVPKSTPADFRSNGSSGKR